MSSVKHVGLCALIVCAAGMSVFSAEPGRTDLAGHIPAAVRQLSSTGRLSATNHLSLAIGLPLRNQAELGELLRQLYDPASPNFHKFLQPPEFAARFGATEADYQAVIKFARSNGLTIVGTHPNRVVLDVAGSVANIEQAFHIALHTYKHPAEARNFFAPDREPSVPANLSVVTVEGLSDYALPRPLSHKIDPLKIRPLGGSGPSGYYAGNDFRNAYAPGTTLNGAGQSVGLLEFSQYFQADIAAYFNTIGLTNNVSLVNVEIGHGPSFTANNAEVALDIEVAIAMAPGLSQVIVYEIRSGPSSILSRMANDNLAKQLSSSWTWSGGPDVTVDGIFKQMAAQGQSYFQASGDSDAYTGTQILDNVNQTTAPVDSTNITAVGGTTLTMSGSGVSWSSETVWNYAPFGGANANVGSGGGISAYYKIPYWQTNVSMSANSGSTTFRNVPDVALTADSVYVAYNNGSSGGFAGTSCAAPLWAGFCALVNQQSIAASGTTVGFLNPAVYAIANSAIYTTCFHDITTGNNVGTNTPGLFNAAAGYDLATGLGTPSGTNLINALAPTLPSFLTQPVGRSVVNGSNVTFSASASGAPPLRYQWQLNSTNLPAGGNISGITNNILSITSVTTNNAGSYQIIITNSYGSITSSVAVLIVGFAPGLLTQPTNLTLLTGSTAVFSATVGGSSPLNFQWRMNGTNLANGSGIAGATTNVLMLTNITTNSAGNYTLVVTNAYGSITSSVAALTVVLPPAITGSTLTNRTIQCGSNTNVFTVTAAGTSPLSYQWLTNGMPITSATNSTFALTNLHFASITNVAVVITNAYASLTSNAVLTVQDTLAPVITLNSINPFYIELGSAFTNPGASANDTCAGSLSVVAGGTVNTNVTGINTVFYTATDGFNSITNTRTVIVRDTTPPTISWSFTNLIVAANSNCVALMPDVTATNFILATDLSGALTTTQSPTNSFILPLGTNSVVITVADASGNKSYSTNTVVVLDQTPPQILSQPQSLTNFINTTATFSVAASACTLLTFQWYSNNSLTIFTSSTLTLSNLAVSAAGNYFAVANASGGATTSAVATLTVNLYPPAISAAAFNFNGGFNLNLSGSPGYTYILEATTNLLSSGNWLPLATNTLGTNGVWSFTDSTATNFPFQFYRLKFAP